MFRPWLNTISIHVHEKNLCKLLTCGRNLLLENFVLPIHGDATTHHSNECRYLHSAIDNLSFCPLTGNISINVHAEYQHIIPICKYTVTRSNESDASPLLSATSLSSHYQEIYQSTCLQKSAVIQYQYIEEFCYDKIFGPKYCNATIHCTNGWRRHPSMLLRTFHFNHHMLIYQYTSLQNITALYCNLQKI